MARTYFFWDPLSDNILQERDAAGVVTAEYTTEPGLYGNLISQNRAGVESQYHFDAMGSTLALTNDGELVTDTYAYTAFGEESERTGSTVTSYKYVGRQGCYADAVTGQLYARRRSYSSYGGRWFACDPIRQLVVTMAPGELDAYEYCMNSPLLFRDPSGLMEMSWYKGPHVDPYRNDFCGLHSFSINYVFNPKKYSYPLAAVQQLTIHDDVSYCDCVKDPTMPTECDTIVCKQGCHSCVVFEVIGVGYFVDVPGSRFDDPGILLPDTHSGHAWSIPGKCPNTRGVKSIKAEIRLFEDPKGEIRAEIGKWKSGFECCGYKYKDSGTSSKFELWKTSKVVDKGSWSGTISWDCCSSRRTQSIKCTTGNVDLIDDEITAADRPMINPIASVRRRKGFQCDHIVLGDEPPTPKPVPPK